MPKKIKTKTKPKTAAKVAAPRRRWMRVVGMAKASGRNAETCRAWAREQNLECRKLSAHGQVMVHEYLCPPDWRAQMEASFTRRAGADITVKAPLVPGTWMTARQIGEVLGLPMATIKPRVHRSGFERRESPRQPGTFGRAPGSFLITNDWQSRLFASSALKIAEAAPAPAAPTPVSHRFETPAAPEPQPALAAFQTKLPISNPDDLAFKRAVEDRADANVLYRSTKQYLETFPRGLRWQIEQRLINAARELNRKRFAEAA